MHQRSPNYQAAEQKIKIITSQRQNVLFHLMSFFFLLHSLYYYYCFVLSFMNQKSLESLYLNQCSFMHWYTVGKLLKKEKKKRREILWFIILPLFVSLYTHFRSTLIFCKDRKKERKLYKLTSPQITRWDWWEHLPHTIYQLLYKMLNCRFYSWFILSVSAP